MICHEKPLPGLPQEHRPAERRRRDYRYWRVREPRSASGAFNNGNGMPARVAWSRNSNVVFRSNDLWLRRGRTKECKNTLRITSGNTGTTICNLGDLMPEVAHPSTCTCRAQPSPCGFHWERRQGVLIGSMPAAAIATPRREKFRRAQVQLRPDYWPFRFGVCLVAGSAKRSITLSFFEQDCCGCVNFNGQNIIRRFSRARASTHARCAVGP